MTTIEERLGERTAPQGPVMTRAPRAMPVWAPFLALAVIFLGALIVAFPAYVALGSVALVAMWGLLRTKPKNTMGLLARFAALGAILAIGFALVERESAYLLPALLFALIGVVLYAKRNDPTMDLFAPFVVTCMGFMILFAWVPLQHLWNGDIRPDLITRSVWYISIGFACFLLGYAVPLPTTKIGKLWLRGDNWPLERMTSAAIICSLIGLGIFYFIMRAAGYTSLIAIYRDVFLFRLSTYGELTALVYLDNIVLSTGCILLVLRILKKRRLLLRDAAGLGAYFFLVFAIYAASGSRGPSLILLVGMVLCFHYLKHPVKPRQIALVATFAVLFAAAYGLYRNAGSNWQSAGQAEHALRQLNVYDAVLSRLDCFSLFTIVVDHPPQPDPRSLIMGLLLRPLPRQWAPDKPFASGAEITREYFPGYFSSEITFEPAIFGELYFYCGFWGIVIGMIVFGLSVKAFQKYYEGRTRRADFLLHYALIFIFPLTTLLGGFDSVGTYAIALYTVWAWIVLSFLNAKGPRGKAPQRVGPAFFPTSAHRTLSGGKALGRTDGL